MKPAVAIAAILLTLATARPAASAGKIPLNYRAYDAWMSIRTPCLSPDGKWFAYALAAEDGDGTMIVHNVHTGVDLREPRGTAPIFTADSRFVIYTIAPPQAEVDAALKAKLPPDRMPRSGLGIVNLATGASVAINDVHNYTLATHSAHWIAFAMENPPSASSGATSENDHQSQRGRLELRNLDSGATIEIPNVLEYVLAPDEAWLVYISENPDGLSQDVHARSLTDGITQDFATAHGHCSNLAVAKDVDEFGFLSDAKTLTGVPPHPDLYLWDATAGLREAADAATPGMPAGFAPDIDGGVALNDDGTLAFIGTNVVPTPMPSDTPAPMQVDLWNWRDARLQSEQKVEAKADSEQTFAGVVHVDTGRYVQLGSASLPTVTYNQNTAYVLGHDPVPYYRQRSWSGFYEDDYAVSLDTGLRRPVAVRSADGCSLSPAGKYTLCYDRDARDWYTVRNADGRRADLTKGLPVAFYDELDDHPAPPPPYGSAGWTTGDDRVLVYDRYDIWSFDPNGGDAKSITGGYGRAHQLRFRYVPQLADDGSIPADRPVLLASLDDRTKAAGLWSIANPNGGSLTAILSADKQFGQPIFARHAGVIAMSESRFDEFPDYWIADTASMHFEKVTDANPQMAQYLWGTEHLIHYTAQGKKLDGILYLPENFDPNRKYPMLVYLYERFSDDLHRYYAPAPQTEPNFPRYVSNGYVLLLPDIAYTIGHPGRSALEAVNAAVDTVVKRGFIDTHRIGIAGHSWGGFEVAYIITKTNRFAAAEAGAAVTDMVSAYGGIRWGSGLVREFQYETGQSRIGATPWDRPDLYLANSALFHVRDIHTPYLTIANDHDGDVPWYQGIEFFTALRRLNKEAYMFSFNGEFHTLRGREQQKYWTVHLDEYFDHFLKGAPEPPWMLYGVPYLQRGERDVRPLFGEMP